MGNSRPKTADWAPGTLDRTRKAIGNIDEAEAEKMTKVLGGEIMYERTSNPSSSKKIKGTGRLMRQSASSVQKDVMDTQTQNSGKGRKHQEELIVIPAKVNSLIDKLMMSDEYGIKPDYGLFNFIKYFRRIYI